MKKEIKNEIEKQEIDVEQTVVLNLSFGKIGLNRKGDISKIETDADKTRCTFGKRLFDCDEIRAIATHDYETTKYVKARISLEGFISEGFYILAASFVEDVEKFLKARQTQRADLVEKFCDVYEGQRELARQVLASQFRADDYPQDPRPKFRMTWRWISFGVPNALPAKEYAEAVELFKNDMQEALERTEKRLSEQFGELVAHLTEKLTPGPDGKKKIFRDTAIENLTEFLALIDKRNITRNKDLAALTAKARDIIADTTPERLRDSAPTRAKIAGDMKELKSAIDLMITTKIARKFDLE